MKRSLTLLLLLSIFILINCGGDEPICLADLIEKEGVYFKINEEKPYTGRLVDFYSEKKIKIEETYKNGRIEGHSVHWYENGQKKFDLYLQNGNGSKQGWYKTGQKKYKVPFKKGKANGVYIELFKSGKKKFQVNYKSGKATGKFTEWEENGWIKFEGNVD